jgi:hypothetical protein
MRRHEWLLWYVLGMVSGGGIGVYVAATHLDEEPVRADVEIPAEVVVDATTIEMRGYGPDGTPGTFLYDCSHESGRLVCTQREGEQ